MKGDYSEWEKEVAKMGSVYQNPLCTIVASRATDNAECCLKARGALHFNVYSFPLLKEPITEIEIRS
jgi:hypothetical protein